MKISKRNELLIQLTELLIQLTEWIKESDLVKMDVTVYPAKKNKEQSTVITLTSLVEQEK